MQTLLQDIRYAVRMLGKSPGFTWVAIFTLALGIGANSTIFSAVEALILHPFSFPNDERLVRVYERNATIGWDHTSASPGDLQDWRTQAQRFDQFSVMRLDDFDMTGNGLPDSFEGYSVSAVFFDMLGVKPMLGRTFYADEDSAGREQVIVLKHSLWQRRFGSDKNIIGKNITLNNKAYQVIGVMPPDFNFPYNGGELWTPFVMPNGANLERENHYLPVLGLLKKGVSVAEGDAELRTISARAQELYPATNKGLEAYAIDLNKDHTRHSRQYLLFLLGAVCFLLLIACANVANLLLVRGAARQKEIAVRMALGASRWRIVRQVMTESILLSLLGGVLGLGLAAWGIAALEKSVPQNFAQYIPGWEHLALNSTTLLYTFFISIATGILFGILPAWQITQGNFNETLKDSSRTNAVGARGWVRNGLVVGEIALSLILLVGAGLLIRSFINILQTDFGVNPDNAISMRIALPKEKYATDAQRINFIQQWQTRVAALPGVTNIGAIDNVPMGGTNNGSNFQITGQPPQLKSAQPVVDVRIVTPGYFGAIGTPLRRGRLLHEQDTKNSPAVMLANESFAAKYFPGREALGQRVEFVAGKPVEIVGIVANVMNDDLDNLAEPMIYQPHAQRGSERMTLVVRTQSEPTKIANDVRAQLAALDPNLPLAQIKTMHEVIHERSSPKRVVTIMLGIFAVLALGLAVVGLYAVMAYSVSQRVREIGVRLALGALPKDIFKLVLGRGLRLILLGLGIGLIGAFALSRVLAQALFRVTATDPLTFIGVALLLAAAALLACFIPASRATKVDPIIALQCE